MALRRRSSSCNARRRRRPHRVSVSRRSPGSARRPRFGLAGAATHRTSPGQPCRRSPPRSACRRRLSGRNHSRRVHARDQQLLRNLEFLDQLRRNRATARFDAPRAIQETHSLAESSQIRRGGRARRTAAHDHHIDHLRDRGHTVTAAGAPLSERSSRAPFRAASIPAARNRSASMPNTSANAPLADANSERAESTRDVASTPPRAKPSACAAPHNPMRTPELPGLALPRKRHHRSDRRDCKHAV